MAERDQDEDRVRTQGGEAPDSDKAADKVPAPDADPEQRKEDLLDEGLEETFPASDPTPAQHFS